MDSFYLTVILIAVVMLIGILTYLGMQMAKASSEAPFPPAASTCPDYWTTNDDGSCTAGTKNLGIFSSGYTIKPQSLVTTGGSLSCTLQKWANSNSVVWDGYNNYNQHC
jgi:hypothetical protein